MKIAILGAGAFGTALGGILAEKGYDIDYYDSKIERESLSEVLENAKMMVMAVPSESAPFLIPHLPKNIPLIVATKGILTAKVFEDFEDFEILSGPGFADDIKAHKSTKLTVTGKSVATMFGNEYLTFDYTSDKNGVLMCGALKNVYAILAGLLNLEKGTSLHEQFLEEAADEMRSLLSCNEAKPETVDLVCGVGDLRLTCAYPSRNFEFGQKLRGDKYYKPEKTVEGVSALKRIKRGEIIVPKELEKMQFLMEVSQEWA
jgi:glycerol-3-phosphate dehydrogenase (NAD(P)+)